MKRFINNSRSLDSQMPGQKYIKIQKPKIVNRRVIVSELLCSQAVKKYFRSNRLIAEYDRSIVGLDPGILQIPAVAGVVTVAWAVGADVYVEELDKAYLESLNKITTVLKRLHPNFPFSDINVENVASNRFQNTDSGLLFTRGIDSITSYIKHRNDKPALIYVWGAEVRFDDKEKWRKVRSMLSDFAGRESAKLHVIRSNIPRIDNRHVLSREFGLDWWLQVSHSIVMTGLCAPLASVAGIKTLLFASGGSADFKYPRGSIPEVDNNISWGDIKVVHDNFEMSRQLKVRCLLKDYMGTHGYILLKVCNNTQRPESNCGKCEKCLRTIGELALEGIDPNKCGFSNVSGKTFDTLKEAFIKGRLFRKKWVVESEAQFWARMVEPYYWQDIQKHIPEKIETGSWDSDHHVKEFFEWFRTFNIQEYQQRVKGKIRVSLPYFFYMWLLSALYRMPTNIQEVGNRILDQLKQLSR